MARLQHVSIPRPTGSEELTRAFYGDLLGLEEKPVPDSISSLDLIWFKLDIDSELHCFREDPIDDASNRHFCLVVDDVHALRKKLEDAGYELYDVDPIPGRPRIFCRDPFRNIIEFTSIQADYLDFQDE
jgi:extradiol dioxygenase family protein